MTSLLSTHTNTPTDSHKHIQDMGGDVFSVFFHFYSVFITLSLSCSLLTFALCLFLPYCFSHLSVALFFILFLTQATSLSSSLTSGRFRLLPQASCVYISVIYFYKCQTALLPSIQRDEMKRKAGKWGNGTKKGW